MAMTKREQAELEALRQGLAEAKALRWLGIPEPTRMPLPEKGYVNGWDFNAYVWSVTKAWTGSLSHSRLGHVEDDTRARYGRDMSAGQGGLPLYATELDALIALRLATERECAKKLAALDRRIDAERAASADGAAA